LAVACTELKRHPAPRHDLVIVERAPHLFDEPGAPDEVARLAGEWFVTHLEAVDRRDREP
jgi:hypothetical protein